MMWPLWTVARSGDAVRPERLRVAEVHLALGGQPGMADAVAAAHRGDAEGRLEPAGRAHLLHQLEVLADAHDLEVLARALERARQLACTAVAVEPEPEADEVAVTLDVTDLRESGRGGRGPSRRLPRGRRPSGSRTQATLVPSELPLKQAMPAESGPRRARPVSMSSSTRPTGASVPDFER